jgi:hypothetical protein
MCFDSYGSMEAGDGMKPKDVKWALVCIGALTAVVVAPLLLLLGPLNHANDVAGHLGAVLIFVGGLLTAAVSFVSLMVSRQSDLRRSQQDEQAAIRLAGEHQDQEARLRIEAATHAGALFSTDAGIAQPASVASSLLSLTRLDRADLAVALLVDFWSVSDQKVSTEVAILVIDAALRSPSPPNARLVAAEILCRNASRLDSCQSLHWPSSIDGCWNTNFGPRTKLLLIEALINMTLAKPVTEGSLRSIAVRLYGIYKTDEDKHVKGCIGKLIHALYQTLDRLGYSNFMQGNVTVMLDMLRDASQHEDDNPDDYLNRLANHRYDKLKAWAEKLSGKDMEDAPLDGSTLNPIPVG